MKRFGGLLLTVLLASTVFAADRPEGDFETLFPQQLSAQALLTYCASSSLSDFGRQRQRYCAGFVSGIEEAVRLISMPAAPETSPSMCVPASATARNFQDAYVRYAGRPGTDLDRPAALVAVEALKAAFPCRTD